VTNAAPSVLVVGRTSPEAKGIRGPLFGGGQGYFRAIERAGGIPLLLPPIPALIDRIPQLVGRVDALVLHGGGDVDPRHYGEEPTAAQLYGIVPEHDEVELAVVRAALAVDLPILAICRGMQVLNVALGGSLVQDIGNEEHWLCHRPVTLDAGSKIAKAVGDTTVGGHHVHHQSIARIGGGLTLVGSASDGTPEAMEVDDAGWVVAVQWHPEDTADADPQQQALFDELVRQAKAR
jgi:putative glutamine amidotransferase